VKVAGGHQKKLEVRNTPMVFIRYEPGSKAYRFLNPSTGRVLISRDAVFDEGRAWNWDDAPTSTANNNSGETFTVEYMTTFIPGGGSLPPPLGGSPPPSGAALSTPTGVLGTPPSSPSRGATTASTPVPGPPAGVEFVSPPSGDLELDADHEDDAPLRFRALDNVLGDVPVPGKAGRELDAGLLLAVDGEPTSFDEVREEEEWRKAMLDELSSIEQNDTWRLVELPPGHRAIGLKWVFKLKRDEPGAIVKHKARLVAKGYV